MTIEETTKELLDKIRRDINGIDLYSLPRAVLCELIRMQEAEVATLRHERDQLWEQIRALSSAIQQARDERDTLRAQLTQTQQRRTSDDRNHPTRP